MKAILRLLPGRKKRIYVVAGEQFRKFDEPWYSTDPSHYNFDLFTCETKSPETFPPLPWDLPPGTTWKRPVVIMKVFRIASDAIDFAYCCNLDNVVPIAYDQRNGQWVRSDDQSAFDIDW